MKFYQLPIDTIFTIPGESVFNQFKKISDTRAVSRVYPLDWGTAQFPFRKDTPVEPLNTTPVFDWEEFKIEVTHEIGGDESEMMEVSEQFESELYRLVKKYQGRAGLKFYAQNTEGEITEY